MNLGCSVCVSEDACDYVCWGGGEWLSVWRGVEKAGSPQDSNESVCLSFHPSLSDSLKPLPPQYSQHREE